jgi:hypothetical protein
VSISSNGKSMSFMSSKCRPNASPLRLSTGKISVCELTLLSLLVTVLSVWVADEGWMFCLSVAEVVSVGDVWLLCAVLKCLVKMSSRVNTFLQAVQGCLC